MKQADTWLLLMHQISPKLDSFRVKIWRSLQKIGALQLKNSVYVLPMNASNRLNFEAVVREINTGQGDAFLCESNFIEGIQSVDLIEKFNQDRSQKYQLLAQKLRDVQKILAKRKPTEEDFMDIEHVFGKLERELKELQAIDFFNCNNQASTLKLFRSIQSNMILLRKEPASQKVIQVSSKDYQGKVWVTRSDIHVDRLASAWLIATYIDKKPTFKFTKDNHYKPNPGEIRFDMFTGEFTHIGDKCTFEVLRESFSIDSESISVLSETIHDLDLKDTKFNRSETAGIGLVIKGIIDQETKDLDRLQKATVLFHNLSKSLEGLSLKDPAK